MFEHFLFILLISNSIISRAITETSTREFLKTANSARPSDSRYFAVFKLTRACLSVIALEIILLPIQIHYTGRSLQGNVYLHDKNMLLYNSLSKTEYNNVVGATLFLVVNNIQQCC